MKKATNTKKENNRNIAIAAGITGLFASALLGAHFLFNTEKGKKSLKHVKSWVFKMKGELLEKVEKVKDIDEATYHKIVDDLTQKYQKIKGMTVEELAELTKELKANWKKIKDEAKKTNSLQSGKSVKKQQRQSNQQNNTSWGEVSDWYDNYLQDEDNYQNKVIFPNLLRLLDINKDNLNVLDLGCGQGFFIDKITNNINHKINFYGVDVSSELLKIAKENINNNAVFYNTDASDLSDIKSNTIDIIYSVLALQNMKDLDKVISEISRVLKKDGRCIFVINHPSFRIPKESDWYFDNKFKKQGRVVYNYMSDKKYIIDMNPGKKAVFGKNDQTISFHHPLQYFSKVFDKNHLAIKRIEEWISHKKSQKGIKQQAEDDARKEIPMFMCLELLNIAK